MEIVKKANATWLKWFKLARYPQDQIGMRDFNWWGQQLDMRRRLIKRIEFPRLSDGQSRSREWCIQMIRTSPLNLGSLSPTIHMVPPISDMTHEAAYAQHSLYGMAGIKELVEAWRHDLGRHDMPTRFLKQVLGKRQSAGGIHGVSSHHVLLESLKSPESMECNLPQSEAVLAVLSRAYVEVDFTYGDAALVTGFKAWLRQKRLAFQEVGISSLTCDVPKKGNSRSPRVVLSDASKERWRNHQVLPYLDIQIMASEEELEVPTAKVLCNVLFPRQVLNHKVKIDQEVKPLAERLLDQRVIERLIADGQAEIIGREI